VYGLLPQPEEEDNQHEELAMPLSSSELVMPNIPLMHRRCQSMDAISIESSTLPNPSWNDVGESSNGVGESSKSALSREGAKPSSPSDGWYVVFHAALPGVYFGM
jgi:hypothetical protein